MIYILFISLIVIFLLSYFFTRKIMSPACILSGVYAVSVYLAILNIERWNISLSSKTVFLILIGVISFVIPSIIITLLYFYNNHNNKGNKPIEMKKIEVDRIVLNILLLIQVLTSLLYIYYCSKSIGTNLNLFNFASKMSEYRQLKMVDDDSLFQIPLLVKQLVKFSKAIIFCYTFVIINNIVVTRKNNEKAKTPIKWYIMIVFFFFQSVFSASRFDLAIIFIYVITILYLLLFNEKSVIKSKMNFKLVLKIIAVIFVLGFLFSSTKEIFGRSGDKTTSEYISSYFGGSIELLDLYMNNPIPKSSIVGKETFFSLNNTLISDQSSKYTIHLEFRRSNGIWIGNVYTALRMYYQDFGMIGVIVLQILYSIIMTTLFLKCLNIDSNIIPFKVLLYGIISFTLVLHSYRDFFYSTIISVNYLNIFFYLIIVRFIMKNVKFKW